MSIIRERTLFHVEHVAIVVFCILAYISIYFSAHKELAVYEATMLFRSAVLFFYILFQFVPRGTNSEGSTWNFLRYSAFLIVFSAVMQSGISITQFFSQSSINLQSIGESILDTNIPGVAEISINSEKYLRSYGTFLHPNILGGYLVFSLLFFIFSWKEKMFHVEQPVYLIIFATILLSIVFSFSKSAFLSIILALFILCSTWNKWKIVPRGTSIKNTGIILIVLLITCVFLFLIFIQDRQFLFQSVEERILQVYRSMEHIKNRFIIGQGIGQTVYILSENSTLSPWELQPPHNIYILIYLQLGLFGVTIFLFIIFRLIYNVPRGTPFGRISLSLLSSLLFIGLFDHYFWDIYVGQNLLWISMALASGSRHLTK